MSDLVVKLLITADGKQSVQELKLTGAELDKLRDGNAKATKSGEELEASTTRLGGAMRTLAGATAIVSVGIGAAYAAMRPFAQAQAEAEQSQARLNAVLRATGNTAGLTSQQINTLADSLAASTQFDDESIRNASAVMATFRNVQGDTFREGIGLAADLSALLGTDLQSAVLQVGKALNEPEQGITALSRAGIQFSDVQKAQIKHFIETNELGKAQAIILEEMRKQFGGTAEAMNTGITKATNDLKKAWNELTEEVGGLISPLFTSIANGATTAANAMRELLRAMSGQAEETQGGTWLETQTARINAMAGEIAQAESDLATKRDNPLAFWLPSEDQLLARIEAIKTVIVAESRHLNEQVVAAGGRPRSAEDDAKDAAERAAARARAEKEAAQRESAKAGASKRDDLTNFVDDGETGPVGDASTRQRALAFEALEAQRAEMRAAQQQQFADLETSLMTEEERIAQSYTNREFIVETAFQNGQIGEQKRQELLTQLWAQNEAAKSAILEREAAKRKAIDDAEFQNKIQSAQNVASILGSLASLSEGRSKKEFETSQRLARAQTIVNTAAAAIGAYKWAAEKGGPIAGALAAGAAVAAGLAQLKRINEAKYNGGGSIATATGGGAGGSVPGTDSGSQSSGGASQTSKSARSGGVTNIYIPRGYVSTEIFDELGERLREAWNRGEEVFFHSDSQQARVIRGEAAA